MNANWASLETIGDRSVLRFERHLAHPPATVWRLVTEPAELAHWFPAGVSYDREPAPGVGLRFRFEGQDTDTTGEILEYEPPKVFGFRWQDDVLRFELVPDGDGCRLFFTHVISDAMGGALAAGRNAAGWDICLDGLAARLDGRDPTPPRDMFQRIEAYLERYGLDRGEVTDSDDGYQIRFQRDLVWRPLSQVWDLLAGTDQATIGTPAPAGFTSGYGEPGEVTAVDPPVRVEYVWRHAGIAAGQVRWEFVADPKRGHRVTLTQTVPAELAGHRPVILAAWHARLEQLFAMLGGEAPPKERTDRLREMYRARLD
jgi:uncharacterized protein YndB with AHSA1/START domain